MRILLTNDDGINAEGLQILKQVLQEEHDVYIIAPDIERSACSNIFTMRDEIILTRIKDDTFSVSGYPADCVSIGIHSDIIPEIDLVISGINHGPNLGDDIHFSGTVAGARTAFIFGKPGIAVSIDSYHVPTPFLSDAAIFIKKFINTEKRYSDAYLNINYPNIPAAEIKGVKYTHLSRRIYVDTYIKSPKSVQDQIGLVLSGRIETNNSEWSDTHTVENSYISITPMSIDSTHYTLLNKIREQE